MMRFTVDARAFSDAMSKVSKVLRKNPIPILEEIAVCIQNGRCTLTATDLETWLVAELPARGDDMSFVFSRTKDVMKACAHFEGELAITFVPKDEKDGKIEVLCEQRAAEFSTASYEDYPECGTVPNFNHRSCNQRRAWSCSEQGLKNTGRATWRRRGIPTQSLSRSAGT